MSWLQAKATPLESSWRRFLAISTLIGENTLKLTRGILGQPKLIFLQGDASKAKKLLKWKPKVTFKELARMMTDADMKLARQEKIIKDHGE